MPRDQFRVSTKVGRLLRAGAPPEPGQAFKGVPPVNPTFDFSSEGALRSYAESLERLAMERVEVLLIHDPDDHYEAALAGAYPALARLRAEGRVDGIGAGMNQAEMLARFARATDMDWFLVAGRYSLLDQTASAELMPLCSERGISVLAGGVYNSGILAGPGPGARFNYRPAPAHLVTRAQAIDAVCRKHGVPLKAAALQFPVGHPAVEVVLTGCRSAAQVEENVRLFTMPIPAELWADLKTMGLLAADVPTPP
jgi:D-threo-aldose 1-dehydrogenase